MAADVHFAIHDHRGAEILDELEQRTQVPPYLSSPTSRRYVIDAEQADVSGLDHMLTAIASDSERHLSRTPGRREPDQEEPSMTEQSSDQFSRLQDYQKRLEELIGTAREAIERQAPEVLDKAAATANNFARRLEDMASDAHQRAAEKEAGVSDTSNAQPTT
jgi:hypothetical protein